MAAPFTTFNFLVSIMLGDSATDPLCAAAFSECAGLEASTAIKTIREGGNNVQPLHLPGPVSYANLSLKRGMTSAFDLWDWFDRVLVDGERHLRANCTVEVLRSDRSGTAFTYKLTGCLPVKIKAPALSAKDGAVAIEEMEIAYEMLTLQKPSKSEPASA